jgi:hypothetical protein
MVVLLNHKGEMHNGRPATPSKSAASATETASAIASATTASSAEAVSGSRA